MRVTVVASLRAVPERRADVLKVAADQLGRGPAEVRGRVDAHLFERLDDPCHFLYVGRWSSREAFRAYRERAPHPGAAPWYAQPPTVRIYEPLRTYVQVSVGATFATILLVDGPAEGAAARRDLIIAEGRGQALDQTGVVEYEVGHDVDEPGRLLVLARWRSAEGAAACRADRAGALDERLLEVGGTVTRFSCRPLLHAEPDTLS